MSSSALKQTYLSEDRDQKKADACEWFMKLRNLVCEVFEQIEQEYAAVHPGCVPGTFSFNPWIRPGGGGGTIGLMKGCVFEKVGVNISTVFGELSPTFQKEILGAEKDPQFWASGVSVVAHMHSPLVPAVHMNTRHIMTTQEWFAGGTDLTPYFSFEEDIRSFHEGLKDVCDHYDCTYYPKFKQWCDEYFYLPHRKEPRGAGGIFYDNINTGNWQRDFAFSQDVGKKFLNIYPEIVRKRMNEAWTSLQRKYQLQRRGRYVEFNLLFDRGTRFGLQTEGNVEAILMSLPPEVEWN
ncbi:MAG: oxygen-dependent coproporphyrinogen oxidase [Alphaproteobacteria bacterium]|nr:oxygen-dependent coproporphyrinogen oxidase [Alphaproteobacteria bacterium]